MCLGKPTLSKTSIFNLNSIFPNVSNFLNVSNFPNVSGFTLVELIVVIVILGISLNIAIPRMYDAGKDPVKDITRKFINTVIDMKEKSVREQKNMAMTINVEKNMINSLQLPDDMALTDVQYPSGDKDSSDEVTISFYPNGFSDSVAVHMQNENGEYTTLVIEPFLSKVRVFNEYWEYSP